VEGADVDGGATASSIDFETLLTGIVERGFDSRAFGSRVRWRFRRSPIDQRGSIMINGTGGSWQTMASRVFSSENRPQYSNPDIAQIAEGTRDAATTNLEAAQVMQQTIRDLRDHKISMGQAIQVYDQLKAAGAGGGPFAPMEAVFWRASNAQRINESQNVPLEIASGLRKHGDEALAPLPGSTVPSSPAPRVMPRLGVGRDYGASISF
jgi:K+-transporting ATPase c subunit